MGVRQTADLAELRDWVEGLRAAAHIARQKGNITLAKALDITRFEVYPALIGQAVGLFALTNIDDDLDLNCASQSDCARSTRDQASGRPITTSTSLLRVMRR